VPNPNPWQARLKRWERQWPKPIATVQAQAWAVLQLAYEGVAVDDAEARRKGIHVFFTALSCFAKLLEASEIVALQERIAALEARLQEQGASNGYHAPYSR
jgi:hypothetical protein